MIPPRVAMGVNRIVTTFADVGARKSVSGSGFWVESTPEGKLLFVTNRHNVDPRLDPNMRHWRTEKICIELRTDPDEEEVRVQEFPILRPDNSLFVSAQADCALIVAPSLEGFMPPFQISPLGTEYDVAGASNDVWRWLDIGDLATFIGFAGRGASRWWDQKRSLPIGRQVSLASYPGASFEHQDIKTADTALVSGLSFSGASGSPVISHVKVNVSDGFQGHFENRVDSAIIGVMSGHFWDRDASAPELFQHSGLSYLTRATSIGALIAYARARAWVNEQPHAFLVDP